MKATILSTAVRCAVCTKGFEKEKAVTASRKGALTLLRYGKEHGRLELATYYNGIITMTPMRTILVHKNCQRDFTNPKRIQKNKDRDMVGCKIKITFVIVVCA